MIAASITSADVKREAAAAGFDLCGIAPAADPSSSASFREWLDRGYAGDMQYLHRSARAPEPTCGTCCRRRVPSSPSAPSTTPSVRIRPSPPIGDRAAIARYAWGDDYHMVIERRLDALVGVASRGGWATASRRARYVDTGPVQERVYAQYAGLGWIGKNTCLINPELGSWIFLSEIICNLDLEPDEPVFDQCGTCTLCLDVVPDRRARRARRARLDALPVLPDDREQGSDSRRAPRVDRRARLRLRHLPGRLSLEPAADTGGLDGSGLAAA